MEKLSLGDKVQVIHCHDQICVGKFGKIVNIEGAHRPDIHTFQHEPHYDIELDDGTILRDIKDWQLKKLSEE